MQSNDKIKQIADTIHGSIQISELEKSLISTEAFNRLHNIYQNSTAYLTYPSNQTKRFVHSLGAMDYAGKMFYFGLLNADEIIREEFLKEISNQICNLFQDPSFQKTIRESLSSYNDHNIQFDKYCTTLNNKDDFFTKVFTDPLYRQQIPSVIHQNYKFEYLVAYQAVRCAALLHDLGHPPFSHITEFALKEINQCINNTPSNERQTEFISSTKSYYENSHQLHEQIGNLMADRVMEYLERVNRGKTNPDKQIFFLLIQSVLNNILADTEGIYQTIHEIVSGPLDCDRMDYVLRDSENSGFMEQRLNFDRLINTIKLVKHNDRYIFCPNIRALGTIEDFFHQYWLLYKYVIYHHRVVKTDYLLGKAIINLAQDFLSINDPDPNPSTSKDVLPDNISGLWKAIKQNWNDYHYFKDVLQWDDAWLLTVLRKEYFKRKTTTPHTLDELKLMKKLEELISNKHNYCSVVKRMSDFRMIDHEIVKNFKFPWSRNKYTKKFKSIATTLVQYNRKEQYLERVADYGFFLYRVKSIMQLLDMSKVFEDVITTSIQAVAESKYKAKDSIVIFKQPKTGLEKDLFIYTDKEVCLLKQVSRIPYDLASNAALFPVFFIYLHDCENFSLEAFSVDIGESIANNLLDALNRELTN